MTELLTRYKKFCAFICTVLAITVSGYAQTGNNDTSQGLPVYTLSQTQVNTLVGANVANAGSYAIEIWTDSSSGTNIENKKLVKAIQDSETNEWSRQEDSEGSILQYDLVPAYDTIQEINDYFQEIGAGEPTGFIVDEEEQNSDSGDQTNESTSSGDNTDNNTQHGLPVYTLSLTQVDSLVGANVTDAGTYAIEIWTDSSDVENKKLVGAVEDENNEWHREENSNGDIVQYDLVEAYDSFDKVNPYISSQNLTPTGHIVDSDSAEKGSGSSSDSGTGETSSGSGGNTTSQGLPVYTLSQTQVDSLVGANVANAGSFAIEIWTEHSSNIENKKLVSAVQDANNDWHREENSNGDIVQYDLVEAYNSFDEVNPYISSQNLTPTGHIVDSDSEETGSGGNTENQDTTSGNTSGTESTSSTDNNSLAYSGKDGSEPSEDLRQDIFDALWTQNVLNKSSALDNFLYSRNELDQTSRDYIREFSESLDSEKSDSELQTEINEFVQNSIDDEGHFYFSKNLRESITFSLDFTGDVDFSSGDYMDREVKAIYSIDSPHLVEQIKVTFAHPNSPSQKTSFSIEVNDKQASGEHTFNIPRNFETNSNTGTFDLVPFKIGLVIRTDQKTKELNYRSNAGAQFTRLTGKQKEEWPAVKLINLIDDTKYPELLSIEIVEGTYDYEAPSDGLDIRINIKDKGGSGLNSLLATFENGSSGSETIYLDFTESRVQEYNGKLSPKLFEDRWQPGTWVLERLNIQDRTQKVTTYQKPDLQEKLVKLPSITISGVEDNDSPKLLGVAGDRKLDFSWVEFDPYRPNFSSPIFEIEERKLGNDSYASFEIKGRFEDTNGDGAIDNKDEEGTDLLTLDLRQINVASDNKLNAKFKQDWFDEQMLAKIPLDSDGKLKLLSLSLSDVNGNHKYYGDSELLSLQIFSKADDLLFPIVNFPELDLKGPQILETIMDQENAILTLKVQEKSGIKRVEIELSNNDFGGRWDSYNIDNENLEIISLGNEKWEVKLNLAELLSYFPKEAFASKFSLQMLSLRDHNERSSTGYDVYGDQNLNNIAFDENFGSSDSGDEEEHDNHNPLLLAVIPSTEIATADTTLTMVFHAPIDIREGHVSLNNESDTANIHAHFDLSTGENVLNSWREDDHLVVEVNNLEAWFEDNFNGEKAEENTFYVSNFHLHGLDGNHYESYFGTGEPPNSDEENDSEIKKPFVFSKPIFKVLEPWEGTDSHLDFNNVPKTIASNASIDIGGKNGIYDSNAGPLRFTLSGFTGIDYSRNLHIALESLDGESDVSIDAHFTKSTEGNNDYHIDIHQELDRFRDTNEIEADATLLDDGKLVVEIDRSTLAGRYFISELRFDNGYYERFDKWGYNAFNSIYLINGFKHFSIEQKTDGETLESPSIQGINLSPTLIDLDSDQTTELSVSVKGQGINRVEALFAQSFDPWQNYISVVMDEKDSTHSTNGADFAKVFSPDFPGIYHLVGISIINEQGDRISFYVEDIQSHMDASPLSSEFSFEIPTLLAKGEFPLEVRDTKPKGKVSAEKLLEVFYENNPIPDTYGSYDGPFDVEDFHSGNSKFDFTIIDEIDLTNPEELVQLASEHQDVWFQRVNLANKGYVWALSVESDHEDEENEPSEHLIIDIDGSVYIGDFYNYWRDGFDIIIDDNSTNWREDRFDANLSGVKRLYDRFSEIRGADAPVSPIVRTKKVKAVKGTNGTFSGKLVSDGNNQDLTLGFQFSEDLRFEETREISIKGSTFEISYDFSKFKSKYLYYRAFARNDEFESFGARKRMKIELPPEVIVAGAKIMEGGWESSNWFGYYLPQVNGWIYHEDLGWCFLVIKKNNHWLWMEKYGWLWTKPSVWPYLYNNENANWLYLLKRKSGPSLFFDRKKEQFLPIHN